MEAEEPSEKLITPSLIKGLASTQSSLRSKSLKSLFSFLPTQTLIPDDDLKRLWKSLFYCMWHCDKSENQLHLINRLSSLIHNFPPQLSLSYFSHFLLTMRRDWPGIDHLRLDKFYLLVRHFVRNMFVLMKNVSWDLVILEEFVGVLEKYVFFFFDIDNEVNGDKGLGNGVSYHVVSVFCDEIKPFLPLGLDVLNLLFRPFVGVLGRSDNKVFVGKVKSHVFDLLFKNGKGLLEVKKSGGEIDDKNEVILFGTIALGMGFSTRFYELGSSIECLQGNRKVVLALSEEFLKLEKEKVSLGIEIVLPVVVVNDLVPQLVPINGDVNGTETGGKVNGDAEVKTKKKSKKSKKFEVEAKDKKSKKKKKKKNGGSDPAGVMESESNGDTEMVTVSDGSNADAEGEVNELVVNEAVMSNLQKQFEKIAAESGLDGDGVSAIDSLPVSVNGKVPKKRKRSKSVVNADTGSKDDDEEAAPTTEGKSVKRVRFAMKNNLVWKPQSPLPPQSVRIPPSSTPRGSALKKGVSPGPIRDASQDVKKAKKKKPTPLKKARKVKSISPAVKRVKKVKPMSV